MEFEHSLEFHFAIFCIETISELLSEQLIIETVSIQCDCMEYKHSVPYNVEPTALYTYGFCLEACLLYFVKHDFFFLTLSS